MELDKLDELKQAESELKKKNKLINGHPLDISNFLKRQSGS